MESFALLNRSYAQKCPLRGQVKSQRDMTHLQACGVITSTILNLAVYPAIYFLWHSRGLEAENRNH